MSKRVPVLAFLLLALAIASSAVAAKPTDKACTFQCIRCTNTTVKLCTVCGTSITCESCHNGTVCPV